MREISLLSLLSATTIAAGTAYAQQATPTVIRGSIDSVSGNMLRITERTGNTISVTLSPDAKVTEILPSKLAYVKAGSYVGTAAIPMPDGQLRAMELQVFPESMRGVGEGTRAWNLTSKSSMTNGTVGSLVHASGTVGNVSGTGDLTITVKYGDREKTVLVPDTVPVVTYAPGSSSDLKIGAHVILFASKDPDGMLTAGRIGVGKNGLVPPM